MNKETSIVVAIILAIIIGCAVYAFASPTSSVSYTPTASSAALVYTDQYMDVYENTTTFDVIVETVDGNASSIAYNTEDYTQIVRVSKTLANHNYLANLQLDHYYGTQFYNY